MVRNGAPLVKTSTLVRTPGDNRQRVVYMGPRGGLYIKRHGQFVAVPRKHFAEGGSGSASASASASTPAESATTYRGQEFRDIITAYYPETGPLLIPEEHKRQHALWLALAQKAAKLVSLTPRAIFKAIRKQQVTTLYETHVLTALPLNLVDSPSSDGDGSDDDANSDSGAPKFHRGSDYLERLLDLGEDSVREDVSAFMASTAKLLGLEQVTIEQKLQSALDRFNDEDLSETLQSRLNDRHAILLSHYYTRASPHPYFAGRMLQILVTIEDPWDQNQRQFLIRVTASYCYYITFDSFL